MKIFKRNQKIRRVELPKTGNVERIDITENPVSIPLHSEIVRSNGLVDDRVVFSDKKQFPVQNNVLISKTTESEEGKMPKGEERFHKSDLIVELEANLAIATRPLVDKLLSFRNSFSNIRCGENDLIFINNRKELIRLYVDIGLANNLVWLSTEFGYRSKEIDESYARLRESIAERIHRIIMPSTSAISE